MENEILLEQYAKYCEAIKDCNESELVLNFNKFSEFIKQEADDTLWRTLRIASIEAVLQEVSKRNLSFKSLTNAWDSSVLHDFWELIDKVRDKKKEWIESQYGSAQQPQNITVLEAKLLKLINDERDTATQLYMWRHYKNRLATELFELELVELERLRN